MSRRARIEVVQTELADLTGADRASLCDRWTTHFGRPPPKGISRRLLERAAAYSIQARALGGLKPRSRKALIAMASVPADDAWQPTENRKLDLAPGTRLLREWHGRTHEVLVIEDGFVWNEKRYGSLSAVARAITGARWSGPRFFGL